MDLTFRQYQEAHRLETYATYPGGMSSLGWTRRDYTECYPEDVQYQAWVNAMFDAARAGVVLSAKVLDDLARRSEHVSRYLMHDYPNARPSGWLPPSVRRLNKEHEAELRAIRRRTPQPTDQERNAS